MNSCEDDHMDNQEFHSYSLSRLATCTTSSSTIDLDDFENFDDDDGVKLSRLSIESFDADGEFSDGDYAAGGREEFENDKEPAAAGCYSLPVTPLQQRSLFGNFIKQYASENDNDEKVRRIERRRGRKRRVLLRRENWETRETIKDDDDDDDSVVRKMGMNQFYSSSFSGESENGGGLTVITRPKGGKSSLCMDMEEVKACRELGFELEFDMATMPSRLNLPASTLDTTSSGGSSPISNWRISSPGDDPKDVKARLKVWAQAVALVSTSPQILSS